MPSTIPYDPSLVLTSVVEQKMLDNLTAIAKAQAPSDIAQDALNDLLAMKRSLEMTRAELTNLATVQLIWMHRLLHWIQIS